MSQPDLTSESKTVKSSAASHKPKPRPKSEPKPNRFVQVSISKELCNVSELELGLIFDILTNELPRTHRCNVGIYETATRWVVAGVAVT